MPTDPTPEAVRELLCEARDIIAEPVDTGRTRRALRGCIPFLAAYAELGERLRLAEAEADAARRAIDASATACFNGHDIGSRAAMANDEYRAARTARDAARKVPQ